MISVVLCGPSCLIQATISSDNYLRVYECLEQPSLTTWQLTHEVDVLSLPSTSAPRSLGQTVTQATPTQPSATLDGASLSLAAHAVQQQQQQNQAPSRPGLGHREVSMMRAFICRIALTFARLTEAGAYLGAKTAIGAK